MNRNTLETDIPCWYEWALEAEGFALRLPPATVAFVNDTLASAHPGYLEGFGLPFAPILSPCGPWGALDAARTRLDTDGWTVCLFPRLGYDAPGAAGPISLHVLAYLLGLYDGPTVEGRNQLLTLDGVGYKHDFSGGYIEATLSPALARWSVQGDVRTRLEQIECAMRTNVVYGHDGRFSRAFFTDAGKLVMEAGASISIGPKDPNPSKGGHTLVPNNMDAPAMHYPYACGLAWLCMMARNAGL